MATEEIIFTTAIAAGGYAGTKLFGTALATMGEDINKLYVKGRNKIVESAVKKIPNPEDGKKVNIRAARDVLWNGAITEDEVCAEYFGGMLAAARSDDGKDDAVVHYVDTIKAMSSKQLELHYVVYKAWHNMLLARGATINVGLSQDIDSQHIFLNGLELMERKLPYDRDLTILHRVGLIHQFAYNKKVAGEMIMHYVDVVPTTFGVMLFCMAHNKIDTWRNFSKEQYESSAGIAQLHFFADSVEKLGKISGLPEVPPSV